MFGHRLQTVTGEYNKEETKEVWMTLSPSSGKIIICTAATIVSVEDARSTISMKE